MTATISAFAASPDRGRGLARDMPVRWAFEELGLPYEVRLLSFDELKEPSHRQLQPFGQIPTFEEGPLSLFESGAIVLHLATLHSGLLPQEENARTRAIGWIFAALSTIEPVIIERSSTILLESNESWFEQRLTSVERRVRDRLSALSDWLGSSDWLEGGFSAGDLLMVQVLRRLGGTSLLSEFPNIAAYVERGERRPAFQRAFAAQKAVYLASKQG